MPAIPIAAFNAEKAVLSVSVAPPADTGAFRMEKAVLSVSIGPPPETGAFKTEKALLSASPQWLPGSLGNSMDRGDQCRKPPQ